MIYCFMWFFSMHVSYQCWWFIKFDKAFIFPDPKPPVIIILKNSERFVAKLDFLMVFSLVISKLNMILYITIFLWRYSNNGFGSWEYVVILSNVRYSLLSPLFIAIFHCRYVSLLLNPDFSFTSILLWFLLFVFKKHFS